MLYTAEAVSIGHPDKIADYISSYVLDKMIEQDPYVRYAVEVMIKDNTVILGGEVSGHIDMSRITEYVRDAVSDIGYDARYGHIWGEYAPAADKINVINKIGVQSCDIGCGVEKNGWGDQGVFVGYACQGPNNIRMEHYLARELNRALYNLARGSDNLGLDIKTQITIDDTGTIDTAIVAIPMLQPDDLTDFVIETLGMRPRNIIINGTGIYRYHGSIADCGVTGRKLACDFYSAACPIGGGAPWTKDGTKADLTLNLYARYLALRHLGDNDECMVYLSSCIGRANLPSGRIQTIKDGAITNTDLTCDVGPGELINMFGLRQPIFAKMCRDGLLSLHVA
ncbi:methionine adenosyltransferase [bacterium]|nr:methionine adenosyltransferase [bacterium]